MEEKQLTKKEQLTALQQQLQARADQLLKGDHLAGKFIGTIELLDAQIKEEEEEKPESNKTSK